MRLLIVILSDVGGVFIISNGAFEKKIGSIDYILHDVCINCCMNYILQ